MISAQEYLYASQTVEKSLVICLERLVRLSMLRPTTVRGYKLLTSDHECSMGVHGLLSYALGRVEEQGRGSWRSLRGACLIADGHSVAHWIAEEALGEDYVAWAGGFERWVACPREGSLWLSWSSHEWR